MRADKELYKVLTMRLSYVDGGHADLMKRIDEECKEEKLSASKFLLRCVKEHFDNVDKSNTDGESCGELERTIEEKFAGMKQEIRTELYQDIIRFLAGGIIGGGVRQMVPGVMENRQGEMAAAGNEARAEPDATAEIDLSGNADIMEDIMKWS